MADWSVMGRPDPAPGNPPGVRDLARRLNEEAGRVRDAVTRLDGVSNGSGTLRMQGDYAAGYREALATLPRELRKLDTAYSRAGGALDRFATGLEQAQAKAGTALRRGTDADGRYQGALNELRALLPDGRQAVLLGGVNLNPWTLDVATTGMDEGIREQVRHAASRARSADEDLDTAQRLADEAARLRADAERRCAREIDDAGDPIGDKPWYERAWDFVSAPFRSWDAFVDLCRNVALVVGVVALFVSGPIGWALVAVAVAAAAVAFYDDVGRYARGEIGLGELGLSALGLIPFAPGAARGLQLASRLGGMARGIRTGAGAALTAGGNAVRNAIPRIRAGIGNLPSAAGTMARNAWRYVTDPVDPVTGEMLLAQEDLAWGGVLPLKLERAHRSSYRAGRWFGPTWASTLDQRVEVEGDTAFVALADGTLLVYPLPEPGGDAVRPEHGPRLELGAEVDGTWTLTDPRSRHVMHFAAAGSPDADVFPLQRVIDAHGNAVELRYEGSRLTEIRHTGGYTVRVETVDGLVTALLADAGTGDGEVAVRRFGYDAARRLVHVADTTGVPQVFDYDAAGRITRWEDRIGTWYRYEYDDLGRCVRTRGADHCMDAVLEYGEHTRRWTNSLGQTTTYRVADGQPVHITDPLGHATAFRWDEHERMLACTDPLGRTTAWEYDGHDVTAVVRPDGSRCELRYAAPGRADLVRLPDGGECRSTFDEHGHPLSVTDPTGATTTYRYDAHGALVTATDALGGTVTVVNDAAGLPVEVVDQVGAVTRIRRDAWGRAVTVTDALGHTTRYRWTMAGRLAERVAPDGVTERWEYDAEDNLVEHVDANGGVTRFEIGHFDTVSARTTPDGARIAVAYDTELRPAAIIDARGLVWRYEYDAAGRVVRETDYDGRVLSYRYDAAGQLVERRNGAGEVVTTARDVLGRVVEEVSAGGRASFGYDGCGRLLRAVNGDADVAFERDRLGRVVAESIDGRTVSSTYDAAGRRMSRRTPSGLESRWTFDAAGQPVTLDSGAASLTFAWDAAGREVERTAGPVTLRQAWDPASRLTSQVLGGAAAPWRRDYRYRPDGHLTAAGDRAFELDPIGQVLGVRDEGGGERYRYDGAGSVVSDAEGPREFAGTRLARAGRTRLVYDEQGRVTLRRVRLLSGGRRDWRYAWDALDRLVGVTTPDGERWRYRYDALGRRVAKERLTADGLVAEQVAFSWDGFAPAEQRRAGRVTTWDRLPADGRPLVQHERDDVDARFWAIVTDLVGTPTELVDETGRVTVQRTSLWGAGTAGETPLRFPGQYADEESGLHYNVFRHYDPASGEYVSPDPLGLGPGPNHRHYVANPTAWSDPLGLSVHWCARSSRWRDSVTGQYTPRPVDPSDLVDAAGRVRYDDVQRWVASTPGGAPPNAWGTSTQFPSGGFRYDFVENGTRYRVWGHGANPSPTAGPNAAAGPTVRVHATNPTGAGTNPTGHLSTGGGYLNQTAATMNDIHIPLVGSPF
jgi:RHS repeat-associated protein